MTCLPATRPQRPSLSRPHGRTALAALAACPATLSRAVLPGGRPGAGRGWSAAAAGLAALGALALVSPVAAESFGSSAASSVSSAGSAASGSVSDSLKASSGSSGGPAKVAQGPYRVMAVVAVADRPGLLELHLRPEAPDGLPVVAAAAVGAGEQDLWLRLPRSALGPVSVDAGERIWAQVHGYGVAFARGTHQAGAPFYLVLNDGRERDLASRVLSL